MIMKELRRRWLYWFDNTMARGTFALVGWLTVICLIIEIPVSLLTVRTSSPRPQGLAGVLTGMWQIIGSTFKVGGQVGHPAFVVARIMDAVVALLFASTLVSLITATVNKKILDLRRGRSQVLETDHVVVAGWSDDVFGIVSEVKAGSARHGRRMVAVLADRDKASMEDEIRSRTKDARIVCRTGNPLIAADLDRVNPAAAQSIIALAPPGGDADELIIKTLLAIRARTGNRVVAAISDHANMAAARKAAGPRAQLLDADDLTGRWIAQAALQPGLSLVFSELLRFTGNEFCAQAVPELAGRTFADAVHSFPAATPVGLSLPDGTVLLNPPGTTVIGADDEIVAISRQDAFTIGPLPAVDETAITAAAWSGRRDPVRLLVLGWNRRTAQIIRDLDGYVPPGSRIDIVALDGQREIEKLRTDLTHTEASLRTADPTDSALLGALDLTVYRHIIVLSGDDVADRHADFRSLVTLLHLRDLEDGIGRRIGIVGEIADDHTRELAPVSEGDDFIISRTMLSRLMTQAATNTRMIPVFTELFGAEGNEIRLRRAGEYVKAGAAVNFATVMESALCQGQTAIGYRRHCDHLSPPGFGVHLNPGKTEAITLSPDDDVIVIAGGS
jgi:Castor and Pollux, part of voltage-gated ion channel